MTEDIPETPEEWFKNASLRIRDPLMYKLVGHEVVPCGALQERASIEGVMERAETLAKTGNDPWRVGFTEVGGGRNVSTVFLGLDHRHFGDGPPLVFETMIIEPGERPEMVGRCSTWAEAEAMHEKAITEARRLRVVK